VGITTDADDYFQRLRELVAEGREMACSDTVTVLEIRCGIGKGNRPCARLMATIEQSPGRPGRFLLRPVAENLVELDGYPPPLGSVLTILPDSADIDLGNVHLSSPCRHDGLSYSVDQLRRSAADSRVRKLALPRARLRAEDMRMSRHEVRGMSETDQRLAVALLDDRTSDNPDDGALLNGLSFSHAQRIRAAAVAIARGIRESEMDVRRATRNSNSPPSTKSPHECCIICLTTEVCGHRKS
jgi:hypothetical protein